jgi:hypothetical protein
MHRVRHPDRETSHLVKRGAAAAESRGELPVRLRAASILLLLLAVAATLGSTQAAPAQGNAAGMNADAVVTVKAYGGLARRGFPVYVSFRVQAPAAVSVHLTMRLKTHVATSGTVKRVAPIFDTRQVWSSKIRRSVPAGRYTFCAVASDGAGHHAKNCVFYRVV